MFRGSGGQSEMDFEYQNQTGPVDPSSPFYQHARRTKEAEERQQREQEQQRKLGSKREASSSSTDTSHTTNGKQGPFSAFNSPNKNSAFADLRPPASSQTWLFSSSASKNANPAFSTPRRSRETEIPSSGPETSPEATGGNAADSESASNTPDMGLFARLSKSSSAIRQFVANRDNTSAAEDSEGPSGSPTGYKTKGTPGRGDIVRDPYSNKVVKRVMRRRKENNQRVALRKGAHAVVDDQNSEYEASDAGDSRGSSKRRSKGPSSIAAFFTFIEHHPNLPHIFSYYAQFALNAFFVLVTMYAAYAFWSTVRADVDRRTEEAQLDALAVVSRCAKEWRENGCASERIVRALEAPCGEWRRCMDQDVRNVGRSRLSATTFAEIFNSFVEPITWKALAFTVILSLTFLVGTNGAFWFFRNKTDAGAVHGGYQQMHMPPPPTPQHQHQQGMYFDPASPGHATPYWQHQGYPMPSTPGSQYPQWRMESPSRREVGGASPSRRIDWGR